MCKGTIFIYKCCTRRRVLYNERCPKHIFEAPPYHRLSGAIVRPRGNCLDCRRRNGEDIRREGIEWAEQAERANVVLDFFRGKRPAPMIDRELALRTAALVAKPNAKPGVILIPHLADSESAKRVILERGEREMQEFQRLHQETQAQTAPPEENVEIPLGFCQWVEDQEEPFPLPLGEDLPKYLTYLESFQGRINYRQRFLIGAQGVFRERNISLNFLPNFPKKQMHSFNSFLRTFVRPVPETFGYLGDPVETYAAYLDKEGTRALRNQFLIFRRDVESRLRECLNILSPAGRVHGYEEPRLQAFREWSAENHWDFDTQDCDEIRLQKELNTYERSHLSLGSEVGMLFDFRELRSRIRADDVQNFNFYPHTVGVKTFREWLGKSNLDYGVDSYPIYLREAGYRKLAERFVKARLERVQADRREFEGLPRHPPRRRWEISLDTTQMSPSELGSRLVAIASELRDHLARLRHHPPNHINKAILDVGTQVYNYRNGLEEKLQPTLDEWDKIVLEIRLVSLAFSRNNPGDPMIRPYEGEAGDERKDIAGENDIMNSINYIPTLDEYLMVDVQAVGQGHRGPLEAQSLAPQDSMDQELDVDENWFSHGGGAKDSIVHRPFQENGKLEESAEEQRMREEGYSLRRGGRETEDDESEHDESNDVFVEVEGSQEVMEMAFDIFLDYVARMVARRR